MAPDWEVVRDTDGKEFRVPPTFQGAEGRYEDWIYLRMLEREWLRPIEEDLYDSIPEDHRPSARAIIVLVFWTYFETRIERLFPEMGKAVPENVMEHLLDRYSSVSARMDRALQGGVLNDLPGRSQRPWVQQSGGAHKKGAEVSKQVHARPPGSD